MRRAAILYPGEMGAALARALRDRGVPCVSPIADRSPITRERAREVGIAPCETLAEAVWDADLIVSVVPASEADAVAAQVAAAFLPSEPASARPVFLDANSTDPRLMPRIAERLAGSGIECLDGAFIGPASRVGRDTVLLLSGTKAERVAEVLAPALAVRVVGAEPGQASAVKLAVSVATKGLIALVLEALAAAQAVGARDHAIALLASVYPGLFEVARRALPTYPRHIARRRAEIEDAVAWLAAEGQDAVMARATAALFQRLEAAGLDRARDWTFEEVIRDMGAQDVQAQDADKNVSQTS